MSETETTPETAPAAQAEGSQESAPAPAAQAEGPQESAPAAQAEAEPSLATPRRSAP